MASVPHFNERGFVRDLQSLAEVILLDHSYAKPWSAHPDASKVRPVKTLFLPKEDVENLAAIPGKRDDEEIDVCEPVLTSYSASIMYDTAKAKTVMAECEKYVSTVSSKKTPDTWEEQISRNGWGSKQSTLFDKVIKVLSNLRLSRLTYESLPNEPVMRRITTDKATKRLRQILSDTEWDPKLVSWLHSTLVDGLSIPLLACYLDVLQTLRAKVPTLVDRIMIQPSGLRRGMAASTEALSLLLKRPWDPAHGLVTQHKQRKLPGTPLLLVVPCGPTTSIGSGTSSKRTRFWHNQLSVLGKVVPVTMHTSNGGSGVSISQCLDHIIGAVRIKVLELRSHFPNRPIILLGWSVGALVSCQVALMESVCAVVCLGFPITGLSGVRVGVEDPLLELKTPTLFIIGSHSTLTSQEDVEEMREKMKTDTSLLVVGGADEQLRLTRAKKKQDGLTQNMVDRLIMDEIGDFLGNVLTSMNTSSHHRNDSSDIDEVDVRKKKRKRSVSRDLSTDMERSLTKQVTSSHSTPKRQATQKSTFQDSDKTLLKLPLGNTMGALSSLRSLSQPSPAKRPRTSKPKSKATSPSANVIHVTGAAPNGGSVSGVVQAVPAHPGAAQGLPLHATAVPRQVPFSSSSPSLASVGRGQTFISLTPKSSDGGARVTQTFITIPRGSSPTVISSTPGGGHTVQYIIKPQSQRQPSGSLGAVGATLAAQSGVGGSSCQMPVRTIVSGAVRHTPISQSSSSSFTSVLGLKGNAVTATSSSLQPGSLVSSSVKFTATSGSPTSGRPPFSRITTDVSQPSTISLLTKDGNALVVSQPISSAPLKGSYKLVTGSELGGATLQAVGGGTTPLINQPQIVVGHPTAISAQSVVGQRTTGGQGLKFSTPTGTAVSLPVSLAAMAGKLPNSSSTIVSPVGGATLGRSSQITSQPWTAPSQIVTTLQRPAASSPTKTTVPVASTSTTLTLTEGGITFVTRSVPTGTQAAVAQTGASQVAGKLVGNTVVCVQSVPKVVPTYVVAKTSVSETTTVASSQPSKVLSTVKPVTVSTERQTGKQAFSSIATTGPSVPPAVPVTSTTGPSLPSVVSITSGSTCRLSVSGAATTGASVPSVESTTSITGASLLSASHPSAKISQGLATYNAGRQTVGAAPLEQTKTSTECPTNGRSLLAVQAASARKGEDSLTKKESLQ